MELGSPYYYAPTGAPNGLDYQLPNMQMWTDWRKKDGRRYGGPRNPYGVHPLDDEWGDSPAVLDFFSLADDRFYVNGYPRLLTDRSQDNANNAHLEALWEHRGRMMPEEAFRVRPRGPSEAAPSDKAVLAAPPRITNPPYEVSPHYTQEHALLYGGPREYPNFTDTLLNAAKGVGQHIIDAGLAAHDAQMRGEGRKKKRTKTVRRRMTQIKKASRGAAKRRHAKSLR
jgi:hypothetical protein